MFLPGPTGGAWVIMGRPGLWGVTDGYPDGHCSLQEVGMQHMGSSSQVKQDSYQWLRQCRRQPPCCRPKNLILSRFESFEFEVIQLLCLCEGPSSSKAKTIVNMHIYVLFSIYALLTYYGL